MKFWFDTKSNKIIRVSVCQTEKGGYTFYKTNSLNKQGTRVRMRPAKWFDNRYDAERALLNYCFFKSQYKRLELVEILRRWEVSKPKQYNAIFGMYI